MYKKEKSLVLVSSVSPFAKNLSVIYEKNTSIHICSSHKFRFNVITLNTENKDKDVQEICVDSDKEAVDKDYILQIKWVALNEKIFLVILLQNGLKIYDNNGKNLMFSHSYTAKSDELSENTYSSGIAALNGSVVCIGANNGSILKYSINETNKISFDETSNEVIHKRPITDLVSNEKNILVSCDDSGKIWVWDYIDSRLQQTVSFEGYNGFSCNCLAFYKKYVLAGYGSGHLRVFDINSKLLISEISGHSKWVTAIDVAPDTDRILSTSEDSFVRIWQMSEQNDTFKVSHEFSQNIANHMLFGGVFLDKSGNSFCVSGYDSLELHYFSQ